MKTAKIVIVLLLATLMLFALTSCGAKKALDSLINSSTTPTPASNSGSSSGSSTKNNSEALVGVWEEIDIDNVYTFNADGTGNEYYDGDSWDMDWELNGKTLTMDFGDAGVETYDIELSTSMLIVHGDGIDFEYIRR